MNPSGKWVQKALPHLKLCQFGGETWIKLSIATLLHFFHITSDHLRFPSLTLIIHFLDPNPRHLHIMPMPTDKTFICTLFWGVFACFELISGEHDVLIIWIYPIENIPKSYKTTKGRHLQTRADVSQPKIATASKWNRTLWLDIYLF